MDKPTTQRFAVFCDPENPPDSWRAWSAYTRDFNVAWRGFVGFYAGRGATRPERKADAIKRARLAYNAPVAPVLPPGATLSPEIERAYGEAFGKGAYPQSTKEWFALGYRAAQRDAAVPR